MAQAWEASGAWTREPGKEGGFLRFGTNRGMNPQYQGVQALGERTSQPADEA